MRIAQHYMEPPTLPNGIGEVVERVTQKARNAISTAQAEVDLEQAERVIGAVSSCRRLYAFGSGGVSSWLVEEAHNRLFRLGITTIFCSDHQMQIMLAAAMEPGDIVLCFSLTGRNEQLVRAMSIAQTYGACTIGISTKDSLVCNAADLPFVINALDDRDILGPTSMRYAFLIAIDIIAFGVGVELQKPARETLRRIKQQFTTHLATDDIVPLCD
jgi:DNA-binding MurR/RpiR family transcriptional regulator